MKKIILLNPPGEKIYLRDYYCSKVSKADYINQPTDLLILSGTLSEKYEIIVIDAIVDKIKDADCIDKIKRLDPFAIIFLAGAASYSEDFSFLKKMRKQTRALMIGTGDVFLETGQKILSEWNFIDAIINDFTTDDILKYLETGQANNMIYRQGSKVIVGKKTFEKFKIPIPRHDLFKNKKYAYPFINKEPFSTVLTNYGCPFKCEFCVMSRLHFKMRDVDDVIAELTFMKKNGINEIYFNDQTFGINKTSTEELLHKIIPLKMSWVCFWRVDMTDEKMLVLMKKAGCHTVMYGVESGNQKILDANHKGITKEQIIKAFKLCRSKGIQTVGTFMIGLPGDTKKTCMETINFALELDCDYAAFNTPVPRMGTKLRDSALKKGLIKEKQYDMDQSGNFVVMGNGNMTAKEIKTLRDYAIKKFYFRLTYVLKRIVNIKNFVQLKNNVRNGISLLFK